MLLCLPLAFWACGDDSSSPVRDNSNRVIPSDVEGSSSSVASSSSAKSSSSASSSDSGWSWDVPKKARLNPEIEYGEMTDTRDDKKYKTVEICNEDKSLCQTWMAENLNFNSNFLPKGKTAATDSVINSWCYDDNEAYCDVAGRLYTWAAAIDSAALANDADNPQTCGHGKICDRLTFSALAEALIQGVCPSGWHLPSYDEWQFLFSAVGGQSNAGKALKSSSGWYSGGNGTDAYGFSALPAGYRSGGYFVSAGNRVCFWSASESYSYGAYIVGLYYNFVNAYLNDGNKDFGFSVRCLQN